MTTSENDQTAILFLETNEHINERIIRTVAFESYIVNFSVAPNLPAVDAIRKLANVVGVEIDEARIQRRVTMKLSGIDPEGAERKAQCHRKRAAKRGLTEHFSGEQWIALVKFYDCQCVYCQRDGMSLQVDHVIPLSQGGSNRAENLQPLCGDCRAFLNKVGLKTDCRMQLPDWFEVDQAS